MAQLFALTEVSSAAFSNSEALKSGVFLARTKEPALVLAGSHDGIRNEAAQYSDLSVG
jgi:hypothetical protein